MKKIISLISLLCLSAPIMGMDTFPLSVKVFTDLTGQIERDKTFRVQVNANDNMRKLADKINQAIATDLNVSSPPKVIEIIFKGRAMLSGERHETVSSSNMRGGIEVLLGY